MDPRDKLVGKKRLHKGDNMSKSELKDSHLPSVQTQRADLKEF